MINELVRKAEQSSLREEPLKFEIGDTVDIHTRILEGDKERIQIFSGTVIATRGRGMGESSSPVKVWSEFFLSTARRSPSWKSCDTDVCDAPSCSSSANERVRPYGWPNVVPRPPRSSQRPIL